MIISNKSALYLHNSFPCSHLGRQYFAAHLCTNDFSPVVKCCELDHKKFSVVSLPKMFFFLLLKFFCFFSVLLHPAFDPFSLSHLCAFLLTLFPTFLPNPSQTVRVPPLFKRSSLRSASTLNYRLPSRPSLHLRYR